MRLLANEAKFLKLTLTLSSLDVGVFGATSNLVDRDLCFKDGALFLIVRPNGVSNIGEEN